MVSWYAKVRKTLKPTALLFILSLQFYKFVEEWIFFSISFKFCINGNISKIIRVVKISILKVSTLQETAEKLRSADSKNKSCTHRLRTPPRSDALRHSGGDNRRCTSPTVTLYLDVELSRDRRPGTLQNTSEGADAPERTMSLLFSLFRGFIPAHI